MSDIDITAPITTLPGEVLFRVNHGPNPNLIHEFEIDIYKTDILEDGRKEHTVAVETLLEALGNAFVKKALEYIEKCESPEHLEWLAKWGEYIQGQTAIEAEGDE